jgi:hypothetical protein
MINIDNEIIMIVYKLAMMTMILKYVSDWFNQY